MTEWTDVDDLAPKNVRGHAIVAPTLERFLRENGVAEIPVKQQCGGVVFSANKYGKYHVGASRITISVDQCRSAREVPRSRSWRGSTRDLTYEGVLAHEYGHHVDFLRGWEETSREWYRLVTSDLTTTEQPVDPTPPFDRHEDFAETFRLFVLNPDALLVTCPLRYRFMTDVAGLRPVETRAWPDVLRGAPDWAFRSVELRYQRLTGRAYQYAPGGPDVPKRQSPGSPDLPTTGDES